MANTITLAKKYLPLLDAKYKKETLTSVIDVPQDLVREGATANSILIPKMSLQGLGDYSRSNGYAKGDVDLEWETHTFTQDRGRSFQVDSQDNEETIGIAFGRLSGEFIRLHVGPEIDAYRFATMAAKAGNNVEGVLTKDNVVEAIDDAVAGMDDNEVPKEGRIFFCTSHVKKFIKQSPLFTRNVETQGQDGISRKVDTFDDMPVIVVPQSRFYTAIDLNDGTTGGQEAGGYVQSTGSYKINFMIVAPGAALPVPKTALPRIFDPLVNQDANAWKFDYRLYHDIFVPDNKTNGIYLHRDTTAKI